MVLHVLEPINSTPTRLTLLMMLEQYQLQTTWLHTCVCLQQDRMIFATHRWPCEKHRATCLQDSTQPFLCGTKSLRRRRGVQRHRGLRFLPVASRQVFNLQRQRAEGIFGGAQKTTRQARGDPFPFVTSQDLPLSQTAKQRYGKSLQRKSSSQRLVEINSV
eukprot:PhF_6_TR15988/c0_g1_i2/m.25077